ncbi:MFS transporter [Litorilinea aerophila]|nr:MFS transporter [Litorilinea aerophila]MCC9077701.1 MFS transporter [Litorilinea aerophila]GIV77017.1 MAG: MFS transporter [Litorilinea sp.]
MNATPVPRRLRLRLTGTLFAAQSLNTAAQIAPIVLVPIIAAQLGGSDSLAGLPSTVLLLGRALAAYPLGWLMDRLGRRPGLALGFLLGVLGALVSLWAIGVGSFVGFCLGAGLSGMSRGATEQARFAAAEVEPPERRAKAIGLIVFAGTVGAVAGPLLAPPSVQWASRLGLDPQTGPFAAAALLTGLAFLLILLLLRPDPMHLGRLYPGADADGAAPSGDGADSRAPWRTILRRDGVRLALVAMVVGQLVMTLIMVITPLHMKYHHHGTEAISWVIMAHTLGMFGLSGLTGWLVDRFGAVTMVVAGAGILALSGVTTPLSSGMAWLAMALFLLGLGWNFCFIAGSSLLSDSLAVEERGRVQGLAETLVAVASGLGSLGTGLLFAWSAMVGVSVLGTGFSLLLIALALWWGRSRPAPAAQPGL